MVRLTPKQSNDMKRFFFAIGLVAVLLLVKFFILDGHTYGWKWADKTSSTVSSFEECVGAGYSAIGACSRRCIMPDGRTFREDLELSRSNCSMVIVYEPQPLSTVVSPVTVRGEAIGNWYFEASFPMRIEDANGNELGTAVAQA